METLAGKDSSDPKFKWLGELPLAALVCGADGQILFANDLARELLRVEAGCYLRDALAPGDWEALLKRLDGVRSSAGEEREVTIAGEKKAMQFALQRMDADDGLLIVYPREAPGTEVVRWRSLVENVSEVIWEVDKDLKFTYISPRVRSLRNIDPEWFIGRSMTEILPPRAAAPALEGAARRARGAGGSPGVLTFQAEQIDSDGKPMWREICAIPVVKDGQTIGYCGTTRDITKQKAIENELIEAKARLETTLRSLPDMHIEVDSDWKIVWYHESAKTALYAPPEAFMGRSPDEVLPREVAIAVRGAAKQAEADGLGACRYSLPMAGGTRNFEATVAIKSGEKPTYVFSIRDITESTQLLDALRAANQRISLLTHITRHDLINSMTVAEGNVRLAQESLDSPRLAERLEKVARSLREMRGLIMFSKEYQDESRGEVSWHDVSKMIRHEGQVLEAASVSLAVQDGLELKVDPMFRKVVRNLLENVARHALKATWCRVTYKESDGALEMVFEDDGQGIPEKYRARLFQRGQGSNTGLGLYLTREILSIDGMTIDETSAPGEGARFVLRVPEGRYRIKG
jgi:PAS domain S-box-containing protein